MLAFSGILVEPFFSGILGEPFGGDESSASVHGHQVRRHRRIKVIPSIALAVPGYDSCFASCVRDFTSSLRNTLRR